MLIGEYQHSLDAKGRLFIPAKLRADLGERFVATKGFDCCVALYSMEEWKQIETKIRQLPISRAREIQRFLIASADEIVVDAQGRALIPQVLRNYAKLERDAVVIGVGNRAEIWQPELWQQECGNMVPEDIMDHVADLGF